MLKEQGSLTMKLPLTMSSYEYELLDNLCHIIVHLLDCIGGTYVALNRGLGSFTHHVLNLRMTRMRRCKDRRLEALEPIHGQWEFL